MKVSIFTDASVNAERKRGGYAYYVGCKAGAIKKSGKIGYDVIDAVIDGIIESDGIGSDDSGSTMETDTMGGGDFGGGGSDGDW